MALVFALEAIFVFMVTRITDSPVLFVVVFSLVFFCWGRNICPLSGRDR